RPAEGDDGRIDIRPGPEHVARHGMEPSASSNELNQHRHRAVRLRRRLREEPVRDLPLHHHAPKLDVWKPVAALADERRRVVVGQVGDQLGRARRRFAQVEPQSVAETQLDVRPPGDALDQLRPEGRVELHRVHLLYAVGEERRQDAETRTDLQNDVALLQLREPSDDAEDVLVDEEVLAELLLRAAAPVSPNAAAAFSSMRLPSSARSSRRVSASEATVWTT